MSIDHLKFCTVLGHVDDYQCARCRQTYCLSCDHASDSDVKQVKTIVRFCPDWRCQREKQLEEGTLAVIAVPGRTP